MDEDDLQSEIEMQLAIQQEIEEMQIQAMLEEEQRLKAEEKVLKNKLKAMSIKIAKTSQMALTDKEKKIVKKARQFKDLKKDVKKIYALLGVNTGKNTSKAISCAPALPYIAIVALIIVLVVVVSVVLGSLFTWLFNNNEDGNTDEGVSAVYGITGTDFYGARMLYRDDAKATQTIVEDFVEFVGNGIVAAEQITTVTASNGGETFEVELNIDILLPNEDYDYTSFDETDFKTEYPELYEIVYDIAKSVYKIDHGADFSGVSLIQCVDGVKYFGYGDLNEVKTISTNAILNKVSYVSENDTENKLTQDDINAAVETKLNEHYMEYSTARVEKLFVKDYILDGEEMMSNVPKQNYVAMIFMPRKDVTFTRISFAVGDANLSNFTIDVNGEKLSSDGNNLGTEDRQAYIYGGSVSFSAGKFTDIDESNLSALSSGMNLFDVAALNNALTYLGETTDDNSITYLTIKKNGVVINLFNTEPYSFVEYETMWG